MPELPEVEVVRAGLEPAVSGAQISAVTVFDERSLRRHDGPSEDFIDRLTARGMLTPQRRGKFLWIPLSPPDRVAARTLAARHGATDTSPAEIQENATATADFRRSTAREAPQSPEFPTAAAPPSEALVVHLGMSGQVLLRDRETDDKLTRIRLEIEHPEHGRLRLNFVDQRIFGSMAIDELRPTPDAAEQRVPSQVGHIARDPLDPLFDDALFFSRLARRRTDIKRALLDQSLVSGIGNIYADEALWASKIHYAQPTDTLSRARAKTLLAEVRLVLEKALGEGGTSFDAQYVNVNGASGYFSHSLNAYGQQGKECPRCGRLIVRESFMNRGSHFCPFCQRLP